MSAYEEYVTEKARIDALLGDGYEIAGTLEDLDGTRVRFSRPGEGAEAAVSLLLENADARKYLSYLVIGALRAKASSAGE